jgi:hypothetical protein
MQAMACVNNGVTGEVCLMNELLGEVFEPLKDEALFATARQDDVMVAMVWTSANVSRFNLAFDFSGGDHGLIAACECKSR